MQYHHARRPGRLEAFAALCLLLLLPAAELPAATWGPIDSSPAIRAISSTSTMDDGRVGTQASGVTWRSMFRWNSTAAWTTVPAQTLVPAGGASFTCYHKRDGSGFYNTTYPLNVTAYRLKNYDFTAEATWTTYDGTNAWQTNGGDYEAADYGAAQLWNGDPGTCPGTLHTYTFNAIPARGVILIGDSTAANYYYRKGVGSSACASGSNYGERGRLAITYTPPSGHPNVPQKWNLIGKWADTAVTLATDFLDADADPRVKESLIAARTGAAYNGRAFGIPANNTNLFNALNFVPVLNWGFETPAIGSPLYVYHPTGASWTFSGAGLNRNGGPFSGVNAPEGYQCAFIQGTGYIEQSVALAAGTYTISFSSIGRAGGMGPDPMKLYVDGAEVPSSSWTPATTAWTAYSRTFTVATSGSHTIRFQGTATTDLSSCVDGVSIGWGDQSTGYGFLYVYYNHADNPNCYLGIGIDDQYRIWLNGAEVASYVSTGRGACVPDGSGTATDFVGPVNLKQGWNRLLIKAHNGTGGFGWSVRLAKPDRTYIGDCTYAYTDATAPSNPSSCTDSGGSANDTWTNSKNDPNFTWSGAADPSTSGEGVSGVRGYYYYWGTTASGTSTNYVDAAAHNPAAVTADGTYYLRVRTYDHALNDASAWQTLYTLKYDATAPGVSGSPEFVSASATAAGNVTVRWKNGTYADASSGLKTSPLAIYEGANKISADLAASVTTASLTASAGTHTYTLKVADNAGNLASVASITCNVKVPADANNPWIFTTPAVSLAPPGVYPAAESKVFASSNAKLFAFKGTDADPLWAPVTAGGAIMGRAIPASLASQFTVLAGAQDNKVYARNVSDGTERWTHDFGSDYKVTAKPAGIRGVTVGAYAGDVVFAATDSGVNGNLLRALRADTGAVLWTYADAVAPLGPVLGSPLVLPNKGLVVFATSTGVSIADAGRVVAVNVADGSWEWEFASGQVGSAPGTNGSESAVYVVNETGSLYALNASNGAVLYGPVSLGSSGIYGTPTWHGNGPRLYLSSKGGKVYALDPATGDTAAGWSGPITIGQPSNPVVFNQGLYVGSSDGNLYEYAITSGAQTGVRAIGSTVGDPVVDAYLWRIYAGAADGRIYAFTTPF